ncbi:sulfotransferase domain-containing protein [Pseudoalteromonas sp. SYSU M81236]|jgi:hypothetical protein|uniref:sulfotransferase domain-containing protein n=1 Tax=Pseudoalteromonas sp. SYSU M81236 TaxID=3447014 RepID=UPI003F0E0013
MNKIILSGQPRTGYALFNTIIHKLLLCSGKLNQDINKKIAQNAFQEFGIQLYHGYMKALEPYVKNKENIIINGEFRTICGGPQWFGPDGEMYVRKYIGIVGMGDILVTHKIPSELKYFYDSIHSHENPSNLLNLVDNKTAFATVRNPLGIFNSANHSINALSSEYLQKFCPDKSPSDVREEMSICKFSDLKLCTGLLKHQKKYWDEFLNIKDNFNVIKWEDLITHPITTLEKISAILGISLPHSALASIWNSMDHVNTMLYHQHNYREQKGIIGDWKNNIVNEHIELFLQHGFQHIVKDLGYSELKYLNENEYTPKQREIAENIKNGNKPTIKDRDFLTFSFNKSNIDASEYNFYVGDWVENTKIERSTFTNIEMLENIILESNKVLNRKINKKIKAEDSCFEKLEQEIKSTLNQGLNLGLWGISSDFSKLINELGIDISDYPNLTLFDQLESGLIINGKTVAETGHLKSFNGKVIALPQHDQAIESMKKFAQGQGFSAKLITKENFE